MNNKFRNFIIKRTCDKTYKDYHSYKNDLEKDFHKRCAYCNLNKEMITSHFEIDHYIPRKIFEKVWPELETDYNNLILSCPKCNHVKGDKYQGDLSKKIIDNELFYDPVKIDYATIFYRNEIGEIVSDDSKGRKMINLLELYKPIHSLAFICDFLKETIEKLESKISTLDETSQLCIKFKDLLKSIKAYYSDCRDVFIANYNKK